MDDLPTDYDAIIVGTGMIESVLAAALSRVGKSVLHLDSNDHYGENWASFSLEGFETWIKNSENKVKEIPNENFDHLLEDSEKILEISHNLNVLNAHLNYFSANKKNTEECEIIKEDVKEVKEDINTEEEKEDESEKPLKPEEALLKLSRRFNLDLCPKLLFSKGLLVQLLITSNIARYAEFKSVSRVLTWREGQLEPVPCSRSDVFATKNVTVVHKRILVKILTLFSNYTENLDEFKAFEKKTFLEYLKHKKLPENLIHYILYAIAMGDNTTPCLDGVKNCKAFLESLGRYGNTPFIFPMYGSGELPQCFCRLCAVYGGIYCLQRGIEALIVKDDQCVGVISNKKRLNAKTVVLSSKYSTGSFEPSEQTDCISRGIFITDRSILKNDKDSLTLLQFPPIPQVSDKSVTVIELGPGTCTCPENYFVVHMTAKMTKDACSDLKHVAEALFQTEETEKKVSKPKVLWSGTWNVDRTSRTCRYKNVVMCGSVDPELDYDFSVSEVKRIFRELCPEEEFLPRAPDPEEIVLDVEEPPNDAENKTKDNTDNETEKPVDPVSEQAEKPVDHVTEQAEKPVDPVTEQAEKPVDPVTEQAEKPVDPVTEQAEKLVEPVTEQAETCDKSTEETVNQS